MKKILTVLLSAILLLSLCACGAKKDSAPIDFTIEMQDGSLMKGELYPDVAPITVANFVKLCNENFYEGLIFHRVIAGFMIQGGAFTEELYSGNINQKKASEIKGEFAANGVKNELKHTRGVISMARTNEPNSASSQFFIMHRDNPSLDGNYAAFGKITEGLEVIDKIATVETGSLNAMFDDVPKEAQVIKTIKIDSEEE
ncbi:MAG: peptidylprolyl isomerase [Eubacteriales bacterium]|nr:peptidylprolyl isomerase [Eubacteriales bacterium]